MASVVPFPCMMVIVVIIMGFVAARQCHGGYAYEEEHAKRVLDVIFHGGRLGLVFINPARL